MVQLNGETAGDFLAFESTLSVVPQEIQILQLGQPVVVVHHHCPRGAVPKIQELIHSGLGFKRRGVAAKEPQN